MNEQTASMFVDILELIEAVVRKNEDAETAAACTRVRARLMDAIGKGAA